MKNITTYITESLPKYTLFWRGTNLPEQKAGFNYLNPSYTNNPSKFAKDLLNALTKVKNIYFDTVFIQVTNSWGRALDKMNLSIYDGGNNLENRVLTITMHYNYRQKIVESIQINIKEHQLDRYADAFKQAVKDFFNEIDTKSYKELLKAAGLNERGKNTVEYKSNDNDYIRTMTGTLEEIFDQMTDINETSKYTSTRYEFVDPAVNKAYWMYTSMGSRHGSNHFLNRAVKRGITID